jgi:hypothetical protein
MEEERPLGFVHRVIARRSGLKEYAILVTNKRSIFILQHQSRSGWMLRMETWFGSSVITDARPKVLEDYAGTDTGSLAADPSNIAIPHERVTRLGVSVGRMYPVYRVELDYMELDAKFALSFFPVPLGIYMRDRRLDRAREVILRQYAGDVLSLYRHVLPSDIIAGAMPGD